MTVIIDGGAGVTFPDTVQQTNGMTMTGGDPKYYAARAWVNFNGQGTIALRASVGVSSLTDLGTGNYRVNFSISMPDVNYASIGSCDPNTAPTGVVSIETLAASSVTIRTSRVGSGGISNEDMQFVLLSVFR